MAPENDHRSATRKAKDEQIANEPRLPAQQIPPDAPVAPVESYLSNGKGRPVAVTGVVENGLVRPLDPNVKLPEHSRVIIVASMGS